MLSISLILLLTNKLIHKLMLQEKKKFTNRNLS